MLMELVNTAINIGFIFGPTFAYIKQFYEIKKNKQIGSFSHDICGVVIFGQAFRIFYW